MQFFRPEVLQARSAQWLGSVRLDNPFSFTAVALVALTLGGLLVAFAAWGDVTRKSKVNGLLVPAQGSLNITAGAAGVVAQRPIVEGQTVQAGDVLFVLNTERQSLVNGGVGDNNAMLALQIQARLRTLQSEQELRQSQTVQRQQTLTERLRSLATQIEQTDGERRLLQQRLALAEKTVARHEQLVKDGFVSDAQLQTKQEELLDTASRLQTMARTRTALVHDSQTLQGELQALPMQLATEVNQIERNQAAIQQELAENDARKTTVVTAPFDGMVTALNLQPGQAVQAGQTLVTLIASPAATSSTSTAFIPTTAQAAKIIAPSAGKTSPSALQAHLYAPSRTAGFIRPGQNVYLRYSAYPYQKFGLHTGQVIAISATPFAPSELPPNISQQLLAQAGSNEALYRISVQLDAQTISAYGQEIALKPGLTLEADVLQESRKVWEWILEPVLAARQQMKLMTDLPTKPLKAVL
jgi:membrane fusion protein